MALAELIRFYNEFSPESTARFPEFYSAEAYFKDPFNEVRGIEAIQRIFRHMFTQVTNPRFVVTESIAETHSVMLLWHFDYSIRIWGKEQPQVIRGVSHLRFDAAGKVCYHRDYWDAAEELYMKLPLLGVLMRWLKKVMSAQ